METGSSMPCLSLRVFWKWPEAKGSWFSISLLTYCLSLSVLVVLAGWDIPLSLDLIVH